MIGTSPPKQKPRASVTLKARIVAAAASAAFPPRFSVSSPAATASAPPPTTAPFVPVASPPGNASAPLAVPIVENATSQDNSATRKNRVNIKSPFVEDGHIVAWRQP